MGFLKRFSGSAGTMQIQVDKQQVRRGDSVEATLTLTATGDLSGKGVHLELVGLEEVRVRRRAGSTSAVDMNSNADERTYEQRVTLDPNEIRLASGETRQFRGAVQVPQGGQPSYRGVNATHTWKLRGLVDVSMGQDVDSEVQLEVG
jgi:hypothetical protein